MPKSKIILLIEDNPDDIALTLRAFKKCSRPHEIAVIQDGREALEYLFCTDNYASREKTAMPNVVLLDLKLKTMNGLEVLKRMRADARTKFIPVVILTSSKEKEDIDGCYGFGANSYVCKPVDFHEFVNAVRHLEPYWLGLNVMPRSMQTADAAGRRAS
jgi:two-component system response regulator